ncbi:MAG TPA: hypothetical protein VMZ26_09610 [Pyrinomonadaceae bacterium]|nr:hypothetical protein [Pyrinomonadaceae bacterium]
MTKSILILILFVFLATSVISFGQGSSHARSFESRLRCKSDPQAAKLLMDMRRDGFINRPYVVEDSVSYFKLLRPIKVLGFNPYAVFGFQQGYPKFFERGPGTAPPEMIGIVVRGNQSSIKLKLRNMGIDNLEVEPRELDANKTDRAWGRNLVSIACWAN